MFVNIGYHTRLYGKHTVKVSGGSFGGDFGLDTANRLVNAQFTVKVMPSGRAVFVDRAGREVTLYMTVDPQTTEAGKAALAEDRRRRDALQVIEDDKARRVQDLMDSMSNDEILQRLGAA